LSEIIATSVLQSKWRDGYPTGFSLRSLRIFLRELRGQKLFRRRQGKSLEPQSAQRKSAKVAKKGQNLWVWQTVEMKKPFLRVTKWLGDIPVEAHCILCPETIFKARSESHRPSCDEYAKSLEAQFQEHRKLVHGVEPTLT